MNTMFKNAQIIVIVFFASIFYAFSGSNFGGIIIGTDVMNVTSKPGTMITKVVISGDNGKVYTFPGCGAERCQYDATQIAVGCYTGVIETSQGTETGFACKK